MTNVAVEVKPELFVAADLTREEVQNLVKNDVTVYEIGEVFRPKRLEEGEVASEEVENDKGMFLLIPGLPSAAVLIGAAAIGIVGGAASTVGGKLVQDWWPHKKPTK